MTAAIYSLSAVLVAALATRAWLLDRDDRARQAVLGVGWSMAIAYMALALSFLPNLDGLHGVWTVASTLVPAFLWRAVDQLFPGRTPQAWGRRLLPAAWVTGLGAALAHALFWGPIQHTSPPEAVAGAFAFAALGASLVRLRHARFAAASGVIRTRVDLAFGITSVAILLAFAEWVVRTTQPWIDTSQLTLSERGLALHGALPPVSALFATAVVYVLYHSLQAHRLVALQEMVARVATTLLPAVALVFAFALTGTWVSLTRFPLHSSFLLLLLSAVTLSLYDAARPKLLRRANQLVNRARQDLDDALDALHHQLVHLTDGEAVAHALASHLHDSGRFDAVGVWLLSPTLGAFRRVAGHSEHAPLQLVAGDPLVARFDADVPWIDATDLPPDHNAGPLGDLLEALDAEVVVPLRAPEGLVGWIALRARDAYGGLSPEERDRIATVALDAGLVLGNIESFRRMAEARRLASIGAMAAGLAHEIRNPLAGVKGAAQVLQHDILEGQSAEMLAIILHETERLDRVVHDFLAFARPLSLEPAITDVGEVVARAVAVVAAEPRAQRVKLDLAPPAGPLPCRADAHRLAQVMHNLLRNALDAVDEGGHVQVWAQATPEGGAEIGVRDDGPGIAAEARAQLFTPFFTTKHDGTGLGLPISHRIVTAHGGTLTVDSTPGEGATFVVRLPPAATGST